LLKAKANLLISDQEERYKYQGHPPQLKGVLLSLPPFSISSSSPLISCRVAYKGGSKKSFRTAKFKKFVGIIM
jgi:hypothetical protein